MARYTDEMKAFLRDNSTKFSRTELTEKFNKRFGTNKSVDAIKGRCKDLGFYAENKKYTKEQNTFLAENSTKYSRYELTKCFNEKFGTEKSVGAIVEHCSRIGVRALEFFTKEHDEWIIKHFDEYSYKEMNDMFYDEFGIDLGTYDGKRWKIEYRCRQLGMTKHGWYSEEEDKFIKDNATEHSCEWIARELNKKFGTSRTRNSVKGRCKKLGLEKPKVYFDTYDAVSSPIGSIRKLPNGGAMIKIATTRKGQSHDWKYYGRWVYEQAHNVELEPNQYVIHINGDRDDYSIDNLVAVTGAERMSLLANGWYGKGEITKVGIAYARLKNAIKEKVE